MATYGERLTLALNRLNMGQSELARRVSELIGGKVSPQTFQHLCDPEKNARGSKYTNSAAEVLGVRAPWLEREDDVIIKTNGGQVMIKRLISRRGGIVLASYNDQQVFTFQPVEIVWMYYVAYPVPSRKIRNRI